MPNITGHTKSICIIGQPVEHSLSPAMHTFSFEHLGVDCVYLAYEVTPEELEAAPTGLKNLGFLGYNITMPHKREIIQYLDEVSEEARIMGAVNTVAIRDGKAIGFNTDGAGFMRSLAENGIDVIGKKITLIGPGGAGSAIYVQAAFDGVAEIDIFRRNNGRNDATDERVKKVAEATGCKIRLLDLADEETFQRSIAESALLVNASQVGMGELEGQSLVPAEYLVDGLAVADIIYAPRKTKLLLDAEERGLKTLNGLGMLLWQGAIAEDIWIGKEMPTELVEKRFFD